MLLKKLTLLVCVCLETIYLQSVHIDTYLCNLYELAALCTLYAPSHR